MARLGLTQTDFDVIELNETFASQGLATLRALGIADDDPRVNPNGGPLRLAILWGCQGHGSPARRQARAGDDVRRRWPGHRRGVRAGVTQAPAYIIRITALSMART